VSQCCSLVAYACGWHLSRISLTPFVRHELCVVNGVCCECKLCVVGVRECDPSNHLDFTCACMSIYLFMSSSTPCLRGGEHGRHGWRLSTRAGHRCGGKVVWSVHRCIPIALLTLCVISRMESASFVTLSRAFLPDCL
jgi:hypothetical protein